MNGVCKNISVICFLCCGDEVVRTNGSVLFMCVICYLFCVIFYLFSALYFSETGQAICFSELGDNCKQQQFIRP
jgi:hypothetical protein